MNSPDKLYGERLPSDETRAYLERRSNKNTEEELQENDLSVANVIGWQILAACRREDPELFFSQARRDPERAKEVCTTCPVKEQCIQTALSDGHEFGVWGGMTEGERRAKKRRDARSHLSNS